MSIVWEKGRQGVEMVSWAIKGGAPIGVLRSAPTGYTYRGLMWGTYEREIPTLDLYDAQRYVEALLLLEE